MSGRPAAASAQASNRDPMAEPAAFPHLFAPLTLAGRRLRNRLCLTATLTNYARFNRITDRWKQFLIERARGGAAMLVSEVIAVDPNAIAQASIVTGFDEANAGELADTAEQVHAAGAWLVGQLWHPGRQQLWHPTISPMGVSDLPDAYSWTVPHVMRTNRVRRVIDSYVATAERLHRLGFAGVELHGAHGYLIQQFMSPWSNTREDCYGGSRENRARMPLEIAAGIRQRCGEGFIIGLKMTGVEGVEGGIDEAEAEALTGLLAGAGLFDYLAYNQGNFSLSLETHVPDLYFRPGHYLDVHARMRRAAGGTPVMAIGRIDTPTLAESAIAGGQADLIGMCRALISDAALPEKARTGQAGRIRPCLYDNFCWGETHRGRPMAEHLNPLLALPGEADWRPEPAARPRAVMVIGAGPAGLEAAWTAAARGHLVTLHDTADRPGGALALEAALPGRADMAKLIAYQSGLAEAHGVTMRFGSRMNADKVRAAAPEAVVLATGASLRWPAGFRAGDGAAVLSARDYAAAGPPQDADRVATAVLFDQDHGPATYAIADRLAAEFARLVLLTPRPEIARNVNHCSAIGVLRRLYGAGVEIVTAAALTGFVGGTVTWRNPYSGQERAIDGVALLVYATPRQAVDGLLDQLAGIECHLVGDAQSPRDLLAAVHGGHAVGNRL